MMNAEGDIQLKIGMLVLEQNVLEKQIGKLRDEISQRATTFARVGRLLLFQPERLVFEGESLDEQFAGEPTIHRTDLDVDSLIAQLRVALVRKTACIAELAELGIDLEEIEREQNLRASRALFHPANVRRASEASVTKRTVGFTKSQKKRSGE
jgi:hypothetical protein